MKSRIQKHSELEKGRALLKTSKSLIFIEYQNITTTDLFALRKTLRQLGGRVMVIKKRLLKILLQEQGMEFDVSKFKILMATVFSPDIETTSAVVYKFLSERANDKSGEKIVGAYDLATRELLDASYVRMVGKLPPRKTLIGQLVGMIAAPLRTLLYVLAERSKQVT